MNGYKWELYDLTKDWTQNERPRRARSRTS